jgi:hypothetical protein
MDLHRLAEERSLAYHRRVAQLFASRPDILATARARASAWAEGGQNHAPYAKEWVSILDAPVGQIVARMTDPSEHGRALRQATPFAGALDPRERWRLWREVREQWEHR